MFVKWYKSADAWKIIGSAVVSLVGAFCCAYYLQYPYNLVCAIACCIPGGIIIRKGIIKALESSINKGKN